MIRIGFDIGGTFTDLVLHDPVRGRLVIHKLPTTPGDLSRAVMDGLDILLDAAGCTADRVDLVLHATTVATNAILERRGSRTALLTTRGFRDVVLIGRQKRYNTFDMYLDKPAPLTNRRYIYEIDERVGFDGTVITPVDPASVDAAIDALLAADAESAAVAFMHAYANPAHERAVAARLRERAPELSVTLSSDVSPKFREYERISTTLANAYVRPIVDRYLDGLKRLLTARGIAAELYVMQSNGGLVSPDLAREYPVRIVESGPAAGVLMCASVGRAEGFDHVLTLDMGGTTAKLGAIDDGEPVITPTFEVDSKHFRKFSGLPLNVAAVELLEIGNGGGSVATTEMGVIRVGPQSAGAEPGPICYGKGGGAPTVTDANVTLGYINPGYFNGGAMALDLAAARAGITREVADPLGIDVGMAAWGIHAVANSNMETAMRVISVERGRDPRRYVLVAFGGAGPLHAARLARSLGIPKVVVPHGAGVGSAIGLLDADSRIDVSVTRILPLTGDADAPIAAIFEELEARAWRELRRVREDAAPRWSRRAYLRHAGQGFEINVRLPDGPIGPGYGRACLERFFESYERSYGYRDSDAQVEGVDWQLEATLGGPGEVEAAVSALARRTGTPRPVATRTCYFPEATGWIDCTVVDRDGLAPGERVQGPAIIEERESTTVVLPGDVAALSERGHLVITIGGGGRP